MKISVEDNVISNENNVFFERNLTDDVQWKKRDGNERTLFNSQAHNSKKYERYQSISNNS